MITAVGPGNFAFMHASENLCAQFDKWQRKMGRDKAIDRFNEHNAVFLGKLKASDEQGHDLNIAERAMVAAIHYVSLLIATGEL